MGNCPPGATAAAGTNAANANDDPWYSFIIARPRSAASTMVRVEVVGCLALPRDLVVPLVTTDVFDIVVSLFLLFFSPSLESRPPLGRLSPFKANFETGFLINRVFETTPIGGFHFRIVIASVFF